MWRLRQTGWEALEWHSEVSGRRRRWNDVFTEGILLAWKGVRPEVQLTGGACDQPNFHQRDLDTTLRVVSSKFRCLSSRIISYLKKPVFREMKVLRGVIMGWKSSKKEVSSGSHPHLGGGRVPQCVCQRGQWGRHAENEADSVPQSLVHRYCELTKPSPHLSAPR